MSAERLVAWLVGGIILAAGVAAFLVHCVAEAMRGRGTEPPDDECRWCRKPRYADIAVGPRDCKCTEACGVMWCQRYPVTRTGADK